MLTLLLFLSLVALVLLEQKMGLGVKWVDGISGPSPGRAQGGWKGPFPRVLRVTFMPPLKAACFLVTDEVCKLHKSPPGSINVKGCLLCSYRSGLLHPHVAFAELG